MKKVVILLFVMSVFGAACGSKAEDVGAKGAVSAEKEQADKAAKLGNANEPKNGP